MLTTLALSIGMDDVEVDGLLSALHTAGAVILFLIIIATALIAFHHLERWRDERKSPVDHALRRKRHFGGF